jgi:PAS domain S-box-containing protein
LLPAHPDSVGEARRLLRTLLDKAGDPELIETVELVVSEVVTNAVLHAGTEVDLVVTADDLTVRVEVTDGSPHLPRARSHDGLTNTGPANTGPANTGLANTGRGLHLVDVLAHRWGVIVEPPGKKVWFEVSTAPRSSYGSRDVERPDPSHAAAPTPSDLDPEQEPEGRTLVSLLGVPLLLHSAWQLHAESLLREYLLTCLTEPSSTTALEVHAAAHDAMALLREHITDPDFGLEPAAVIVSSTDPLSSAADVVVPVPSGSVRHFDVLEEALDAAATAAEAGHLLIVPMQPELRQLRRWLCGQVREQAAGRSPAAWLPDPLLSVRGVPDRDIQDPAIGNRIAEISTSTRALIAADDTNRIIALSQGAVHLLGYRTATDLIGQRLVTIIPQRYRQAHIAGFTLHLVTGRRPLLEAPIAVPALRADGTEIMVQLNVSAHRHHGQSIFEADLREVADHDARRDLVHP